LLLFDEMHERFGRRASWPPSASLASLDLVLSGEALERLTAGSTQATA
jgi:hypothetical protein